MQDVSGLSDTELRRRFTEATEPVFSAREVEERTGISYSTVARIWRGESKRLTADTRRKILRFLEEIGQTSSVEAPPDDETVSGGGYPEENEVEDLLYSLDEVMRTLRKIDPEPGSQRARKKDALRLLREFWATLGEPIPDWFWDIQERVERGEL